jgi:hypothetical protein
MNRKEVWETAVSAIEQAFQSGEFEEGEFEVAHNTAVGSITIIHRPTNQVFSLTDSTYSHYDSEMRMVWPTHSRVTGTRIDYSYRR